MKSLKALVLIGVSLGLFLGALTGPSADAQASHNGKWGLGLSANLDHPSMPKDVVDNLDNDYGYSIWVRKHLSNNMFAHIELSRWLLDGATGVSSTNFDLKANWRLMSGAFAPVVGLGAGLARVEGYTRPKTVDGLDLVATAGVEYVVSPAFVLGAWLNYHYAPAANEKVDGGRDIAVLSPSVGLTFYMAANEVASSQAAAPVAVSKPVVQVADADGDGIADEMDKCNATPAGAKVNAYGCQEKEKATVTLNVQFAAGKSVVTPEYESDVEKVAAFMTQFPDTKVEIEGHTDNTGKETGNQRISQVRANAIRDLLVQKYKIDAKRISAKGYGSSKPIADNATEEGRKTNRRVQATIGQ